MRYRSADHVMAQGELLRRMEANQNRLEQPEYEIEYIRAMNLDSWPGDYRGRVLMAMTQLSSTVGKKNSRLEALAEDTLEALSEKGFCGDKVDLNAVNEQQLAGNSWLLRGLLGYEEYTGDSRFGKAASQLFENLFLAVSPSFESYPIPDAAPDVGGPAGSILGSVTGNWMLSSDSGCVFIALDGLSDYFVRTGDERARHVFDALERRFCELDPVKTRMQTHATLSALRGLMRMYRMSGEKHFLETVTDRFEKYLSCALTLNYANYNWFGRPQWTECCAVADSYILCMDLWQEGMGDRYVEIAERILYNGLMTGQRNNGGFGSDCCLTPDGSITRLVPHPECYEAFWCCTMRGAEGLTEAARRSVSVAGNDVHITGWHPGEYRLGDVKVQICGDFPWEDRGSVTVTGPDERYTLHMYPAGAPICVMQEGRTLIREEMPFALNVRSGIAADVSFDLSVRTEPVGAGRLSWKGPLLLDNSRRPLSHRMYMPVEALKEGVKVIF